MFDKKHAKRTTSANVRLSEDERRAVQWCARMLARDGTQYSESDAVRVAIEDMYRRLRKKYPTEASRFDKELARQKPSPGEG